MRSTTFIYALKDPRTNIIRYIGKANEPYKRYKNHLNKCRDKNTHKRNWINSLREEKLKPVLEILEEVSIDKWKDYERMYIKKYIDCDLMNYTDGGDGATFANKTSFKKGDGARKIVMLDKQGKYIKSFDMISDAAKEHNVHNGTIWFVLNKQRKTCRNYIFLYEEEYLNMNSEDIKKHVNWIKPKISTTNKTSYPEKEIYQYDLNNNFIKKWKSLADASKFICVSKSAICNCAKGLSKTSGGFIWSYKNNN